MAAIAALGSAVAGEESLEPDQRVLEALELAIRTREGVPADALPDDLALAGLVERAPRAGRCSLFVAASWRTRSRAGYVHPVRARRDICSRLVHARYAPAPWPTACFAAS